ncbi:MAG: hypothetical protein CMI52_02525 [Parcubacteria group bacterium]|nr:hypothetical protein [Parcubacteria group bacterium]
MHNKLEYNPHAPDPNQGMTPAKWALVGVATAIGIAVIVGAGFYIGKTVAERNTIATTKTSGKTITPKKSEPVVPIVPEAPEPSETPEPPEIPKERITNPDQEVTEIFGPAVVLDSIKWNGRTEVEKTLMIDQDEKYAEEYILGIVTTGEFEGYEIRSANVPCYCMGGHPPWLVLKKGDELRVIAEYSESAGPEYEVNERLNSYILDHRITIPDMEPPESIKVPGTDIVLYRERTRKTAFGGLAFYPENMEYWFTDPKAGLVYTEIEDRTGGFIIQLPDGQAAEYAYQIPFQLDEDITNVVLNGTQNYIRYEHQGLGGCGWRGYVDPVRSELVDKNTDLKTMGTFGQGVYFKTSNTRILGFKDTSHRFLKDLYESRKGFAEITTGEEMSYAQFLALQPVFFWEDPFGRLLQFTHPSLRVMAECGKPVIYLYPQETKDVSVQVFPNGGFTFTEPEYVRGWNVTAQPNGQLTNHADGSQWPYLFWEGHGEANVPVESRGFVVKSQDVESLLEDKLAQLGLNKKETADFNEFWVPKMKHYPYYFVTFYTNEFLDSLAPLKVNPQPDSIIRIMMDYKPLMRPIRVKELPIVTPERNGFTLVEWGGVLRK